MTSMTFGRAINAGLRRAMEQDPRVLIMGEDVGKLGGVFRITDGLQKDFGPLRVVDTPLAESGIMGTAVGLAFRGYRPVVEIQFDGFICHDQLLLKGMYFLFQLAVLALSFFNLNMYGIQLLLCAGQFLLHFMQLLQLRRHECLKFLDFLFHATHTQTA